MDPGWCSPNLWLVLPRPLAGAPKNPRHVCSGVARRPQETLLRVLDALPAATQIQCERVCHEWFDAVGMLPLWTSWRRRRATIVETALEVPGAMACPFGAPPASVPRRVAAAARPP